MQLISEENSHLESISLADSKLKHDIIPLLDALGTNETLKELDISGNQIGDEGARILAKALQINSKLRTLDWDKNGTTHRGVADIAAALESNHTLLSMPMPLHDATQSLKPQTEQHLRKIEKLLLRNQSPHKVVTEQAYRLQQGLLLTSTQQQMVDRLVVQLQDLVSALRTSKDPDVKNEIKTANNFIQDADKLKQLLLKFHLCTSDSDVEARFAELAGEFYKAAEEKMKNNMDKMIDCAKEVCPYITSSDDVQSRLLAVVQGKSSLNETFVEEVILTRAAAGIANRLSEDKLTVASVMADTIMEIVIHQLENSVNKLDLLLREHRSKMEDKDTETEKSVEEDDVAAAARKARNRLSAAQLTVPAGAGTEGGGRSHKRRPTVNRRPASNRLIEEDEKVVKEVEDKVKTGEEEEKRQIAKDEVEGKSLPQGVVPIKADFNDLEMKTSGLKHLGKDRARPPQKRRLPTRPSNRPAVAQDESKENEGIEAFWTNTVQEPPKVEGTPEKTVKKTSATKTPPATSSKTPPPKPAPKPKPSPKAKENEEHKKSSWKPGGISLPGFFKKKPSRDRALTAPSTGEGKSTAWYTDNSKQTETEKKKNQASPKEEPKASKERIPSGKKPEMSKERVPSDKKPEQPAVKETQEPAAPIEKVSLEKEPEVTKPKTPTETKPEVTIEKKTVEENDELSKERAPSMTKRERTQSGEKPVTTKPPILGMKPFALSRDRTATAPSAQSRVGGSTPEKDAPKPAPEEPAAKPRGPPKFGIGIGGGLLAEMKLRQERAASLGRKVTDKPADSKPTEPDKGLQPAPAPGSKETGPQIAKEGLVKPSSFKSSRPRLPSGTPPKPAPRPGKKDSKKESREEKKDENKEKEPEVKKEVQSEAKESVKLEVLKNEQPKETKEVIPETKQSEKQEELDGKVEKVEKVEGKEKPEEVKDKVVDSSSVEDGKKTEEEDKKEIKTEENIETPTEGVQEQTGKAKEKVEDVGSEIERVESAKMEEEVKKKDGHESAVVKDDLWVSRENGKEALRPGGRSMSLKVQRSTSGTEKQALRSATLPKPWSPGQAPSNMLSRKLSWDRPKAGEEDGRRTKRSASSSDEGILEVPEDQFSKPSSPDPEEAGEPKDSKLEVTTTTTNGSIPKSPDAATLEEILNSDGDTVL